MQDDNIKLKIFFVILLGALIFVFLFFLVSNNPAPTASKFDDFAKCLAEKNITMYGAEWCSHCQNEKKAFGDSFKFVPYVGCPKDPQRCLDVGIEGYPTWVLPDGKKLVGEQGIEVLSKESGCDIQ